MGHAIGPQSRPFAIPGEYVAPRIDRKLPEPKRHAHLWDDAGPHGDLGRPPDGVAGYGGRHEEQIDRPSSRFEHSSHFVMRSRSKIACAPANFALSARQ